MYKVAIHNDLKGIWRTRLLISIFQRWGTFITTFLDQTSIPLIFCEFVHVHHVTYQSNGEQNRNLTSNLLKIWPIMTLEHGSPTHMDSCVVGVWNFLQLYKAFTLSVQPRYGQRTRVYKGSYLECFQLILRNWLAHFPFSSMR